MRHDKMLEVICEEIDRIADKGLTTGNIETAYKLIDMYKDLKTVESMEEYDTTVRYDNGDSYSADHERRYMDSKRMYRNDHSTASKQSMLTELDTFMADMHDKLKELKRDADTPEERETIERYIKMLERS